MSARYFLFDLDGTLIDSNGAILASLRRTEEKLRLTPLPDQVLRSFLGPALRDSFMTHYHVSPQQALDMIRVYRDSYMEVGIDQTVIFDGALDFLDHIRARGGRTGVASLKQYRLAREVLARSGLGERFDYVALDPGQGVMTKAALMEECLTHLGCPAPEQAVMFGDSPLDGRAAEAVGTSFVALLWGEGFQRPGSLTGLPHLYAARTVEEMGSFIRAAI